MSFNSDPLRQAQEIIFSRKITKTNHLTLISNDKTGCITKASWNVFRLQTKC